MPVYLYFYLYLIIVELSLFCWLTELFFNLTFLFCLWFWDLYPETNEPGQNWTASKPVQARWAGKPPRRNLNLKTDEATWMSRKDWVATQRIFTQNRDFLDVFSYSVVTLHLFLVQRPEHKTTSCDLWTFCWHWWTRRMAWGIQLSFEVVKMFEFVIGKEDQLVSLCCCKELVMVDSLIHRL